MATSLTPLPNSHHPAWSANLSCQDIAIEPAEHWLVHQKAWILSCVGIKSVWGNDIGVDYSWYSWIDRRRRCLRRKTDKRARTGDSRGSFKDTWFLGVESSKGLLEIDPFVSHRHHHHRHRTTSAVKHKQESLSFKPSLKLLNNAFCSTFMFVSNHGKHRCLSSSLVMRKEDSQQEGTRGARNCVIHDEHCPVRERKMIVHRIYRLLRKTDWLGLIWLPGNRFVKWLVRRLR